MTDETRRTSNEWEDLPYAAALDAGEELTVVPAVETHLIPSAYVQQTYKIQVMQPVRKRGETRRYPVIYVTDGNYVFDMVKSISYLLQWSGQDAPPFILVGIGYPSESPFAGVLLRGRDFLHPPFPNLNTMKGIPSYLKQYYRCEGTLVPEKGAKELYGAKDFQQFIGKELIPFIDEKYQTISGDRTYFGHSGGGFFGLFTLLTQSTLFKNYIVSSPGLLYDGGAPGGMRYENYDFGAQMVREFIASGKSLEEIKLYMSAGAEEEFEPTLREWKLVSGVIQVARLIKEAAIPGLDFMTEIFPGESHISVWPSAFIHGVQVMLGTRRIVRSVYY